MIGYFILFFLLFFIPRWIGQHIAAKKRKRK